MRIDEPFEPAPANRSPIDAQSRRGSTPDEIFAPGPEVEGNGHAVPLSVDPLESHAAEIEPRKRRAQVDPPPLDGLTDTEAHTSAADLFNRFHNEGEDE
jgi:hypothetical protein